MSPLTRGIRRHVVWNPSIKAPGGLLFGYDTGMLLEQAPVLVKTWEQTDRIFTRSSWRPKVAQVAGAGPIDFFAEPLGGRRQLQFHVSARVNARRKAAPFTDMGAALITGDVKSVFGLSE